MEKSSNADLLREMIGFNGARSMEPGVAGLTGAGHGERSPGRINWRNGYGAPSMPARAGPRTPEQRSDFVTIAGARYVG